MLNRHHNPWSPLFKAGSLSAAAVIAFIPLQTVIYAVWPPPTTVTGWFDLFAQSALIGLLDMDLLLLVDYLLIGVVVLALYMLMRRVAPVWMTAALAGQFLGIAAYFSSTTAFEMLALSRQYTAAISATEKESLLAAGQVLLATWQGTAYNVSYVLGGLVVLAITGALYSSRLFGKPVVYIGLVMGLLMLVPPTIGPIGVYLSLASLLPTVAWLVLVSRCLFVVSRAEGVGGLPKEPLWQKARPLGDISPH